MDTAIVWSKDYELHDTGGHPEGSDRATQIVTHLRSLDLWSRLALVDPRPATRDDVLLVHTEALVDRVRRIAEGGGGEMDHETPVSARSYEIALLAVGGALTALTQWDEGRVPFALVRPPGHHATPDRAMGFCLFNNVAIAARTLLAGGMERVAIVDWDVHHGNGTQAAFYDEPRVLFCSLHQWPLYPGSGWFTECGEGDGQGFTVNVPLPVGVDRRRLRARLRAGRGTGRRPVRAPGAARLGRLRPARATSTLASLQMSEDGFAAHGVAPAGAGRSATPTGRLALVLRGRLRPPGDEPRQSAAVLGAIMTEEAPEVGAGRRSRRRPRSTARAEVQELGIVDLGSAVGGRRAGSPPPFAARAGAPRLSTLPAPPSPCRGRCGTRRPCRPAPAARR